MRSRTSSARSACSRRHGRTAHRSCFSSTGGAIYGECDGPAAEDADRRPLAPYGTSKLAAEEYLATWNRLYDTRHVALRLGNVYGPRQDPHGEAGVVAIFLQRLRDGLPATIYGDGLQTRDYVYAGDVASAALAALAGARRGVQRRHRRETSVVELWEACCATVGTSLAAVPAEARLGEIQRSVLDASLAADALGWRPATTLADGLAATWEWLREE